MPPKKVAYSTKRKAPDVEAPPSPKKPKTNGAADHTPPIVDRRFYPPEMTNERCHEYKQNQHPRPLQQLEAALASTQADREKITVGDAVIHWFKMDLRVHDNHALHRASQKAKSNGASLVALYIISPQDFEAHIRSPSKVDYTLRSLEVLKKDLATLDIPLYVETVTKRKTIPKRILELCGEWKANHLYANIEYEVDELRREASLVTAGLEQGVAVECLHDTCVVPPGQLQTGQGNQFAVYSPWFRAWVAFLHQHGKFLETYDAPAKNPAKAKTAYKALFDCPIPDAPPNKQLSSEEKERFASLYPAGEHEAKRRLDKFLKEKIGQYKDQRNLPAANATAVLSPHFASGTLSARTAVAKAREANSTKKLDGGNAGIGTWISEVAWRDFYKHVLAHWPFICMNKCFKPEYTSIDWSYDNAAFEAWKAGRTGYPLVDAGMRQLAHMGWCHNRVRMVVASFLAKDLLVDWRLGEQYFMSQLIDGDFASNHGGWGFGSSTGVDPQPYFRIFNPKLQSEKFDAKGEYIRKWVPELRGLDDKAIHAPWEGKGKEKARKAGYAEPIVEHAKAREKCLQTFKQGLGRPTT